MMRRIATAESVHWRTDAADIKKPRPGFPDRGLVIAGRARRQRTNALA